MPTVFGIYPNQQSRVNPVEARANIEASQGHSDVFNLPLEVQSKYEGLQ